MRGSERTRSKKGSDAAEASSDGGYTLIELMVVTAIFVIISSILLANYSKFGAAITLENLTYDVALSVSQTQVYGIAVQRFGAGNFGASYGMHFASSDPTSYQIFADAVIENGLYDCPDSSSSATCELQQASTLAGGFSVGRLCVPAGADASTCTAVSKLDILFRRPEPDALISANDLSCLLSLANCQQNARIVVRSPRGDTKSIIVEATGQISVR